MTFDPDSTLAELRDLASRGNARDLIVVFPDFDEHLTGGGSLPTDWASAQVTTKPRERRTADGHLARLREQISNLLDLDLTPDDLAYMSRARNLCDTFHYSIDLYLTEGGRLPGDWIAGRATSRGDVA